MTGDFLVFEQDDGTYVDKTGTPVDLRELGVNVQGYHAVNSQEELFDSSAASSLTTFPSSQLPSIPEVTTPAAPPSRAPSVITVPSQTASSVTSVRSDGERRLVSQEAKSDLFEDHLLPFLDTGSTPTQ